MMMIQIEYPAPARAHSPLRQSQTGDTGRANRSVAHNKTERGDGGSARPPPRSSDRRATTAVRVRGPSLSLPPSLPLRPPRPISAPPPAPSAATPPPPPSPQSRRTIARSLPLSPRPPPSRNPRWFRFPSSVSPLSLAAPKGSACLLTCHHLHGSNRATGLLY